MPSTDSISEKTNDLSQSDENSISEKEKSEDFERKNNLSENTNDPPSG
jgi:hypothetical protein